jgi:predicted TIM-barrel fold metal-dependent hydrolase
MPIDIRIKTPMRDSESDPRVVVPSEYQRYNEIYGYEDLMNVTLVDLISEMRVNGIANSILQAEHEWGEDEAWNDRTAEIVRKHADVFAGGFGSVDPRRGFDAVREIDRCYSELGLRGIIFEPGFIQVEPTHRLCYPIYAKCVELGIPVGLHTGVNFSSHGSIRFGSPLEVDQVACDFPDLMIICHHGGWPWPNESMAVAWKHSNVYLEFGAISPKYVASSGGWGDMVQFMDTVLSTKILFGTDWPMIRYERVLAEVPLLGLRESSAEAYLHGNAERLLNRIL